METNQIKKWAVIYCRVSTKEQVEEGNSLVTQERNCREYALKHGFDIGQVFIEQGESAKTADRTELQKLFSFCANKKNNVKAVIAYKIDRISRNTDDYSQIRILLKRYGIEIKSTSEYFENTPAGRFMENIIANVAQFDNDVRTERSVGGMRDATREGRYVWYAPIGYVNQKINGKVSIVQTGQAPLIKMAFEKVAENASSVEDVRMEMNNLGLRNTKGRPVVRSYFYVLLTNELYAGWINKLGERHKGTYEPIVSEELFAAVQRRLKRKKNTRPYKIENPDFFLRRFIYHPTGELLTGSWSQGRSNKYAYYRFPKAKLQWKRETLQKYFLSFIDNFSLNEGLYARLKKEAQQHLIKRSEKNEEKRVRLLDEQKAIKEKQNSLIQKGLTGIISDAILKEQMNILEDDLWKISKDIESIGSRSVNFEKVLRDLNEFLLHPVETWKKMPFHIQTQLLRFEFPKGVCLDGDIFRTTEICSLFKLKGIFLPKMSYSVHYLGHKNEHPILAKSPRVTKKDKEILWEQIGNDLVELTHILNSKEKSDLPDMQIAQWYPLKKAG